MAGGLADYHGNRLPYVTLWLTFSLERPSSGFPPPLFFFFQFLSTACGTLIPLPGIEPTVPALEGRVLTTGPPGESKAFPFLNRKIWVLTDWPSLPHQMPVALIPLNPWLPARTRQPPHQQPSPALQALLRPFSYLQIVFCLKELYSLLRLV